MSHTPGPWRTIQDIYTPTTHYVWHDKEVKTWPERIAVVYTDADAILIAAAPELLAACHSAVAHLVSGDLTEAMTLKYLREAIAKAEGRDV